MSTLIITPGLRLADMVAADRRTLILLPRLGIELGVGDGTVEQVCQGKGMNTDFLLLMVNIYLNPNYFPAKPRSVDLNLLLRYLQLSHSYYLEVKIPTLRRLIDQFVSALNGGASASLRRFFDEYIEEVRDHIAYEEQTAFPYILRMLGERGAAPEGGYTIGEFQAHHSDIEVKLTDLKNLLIKYIPPTGDPYIRIAILNELIDLEEDLMNHARIEEKILIPLAERMERRGKRREP